jgi:hypothetical protein
MMREPEIWREIALYFLATVFAYALGIAASVALARDSGASDQRHCVASTDSQSIPATAICPVA